MDRGNKDRDLALEILKDVTIIREDIAAIKADVRVHIKRTDIIETEIKWLHRQVWVAHGAIALVGFVALLVSIYRALLAS